VVAGGASSSVGVGSVVVGTSVLGVEVGRRGRNEFDRLDDRLSSTERTDGDPHEDDPQAIATTKTTAAVSTRGAACDGMTTEQHRAR
jgi:hypothetical protein